MNFYGLLTSLWDALSGAWYIVYWLCTETITTFEAPILRYAPEWVVTSLPYETMVNFLVTYSITLVNWVILLGVVLIGNYLLRGNASNVQTTWRLRFTQYVSYVWGCWTRLGQSLRRFFR